MHLLKQFESSCETCQKLGPKPIRFKVSLPNVGDIVFGDERSIEQRVEKVWLALIETWFTLDT
jgi:hypothetical protein